MDHSILKMISKSNKESASVHVHYLAHNLNFYLSLLKFSINLCTLKIHHLNHKKLKLKNLKPIQDQLTSHGDILYIIF